MTMKVITMDQYGVTYADSSDPDFQVRFKTTNGRKSIDGVSVQNFVTEVIVTDNNKVGDMNEALSVRLRTSGSVENKARLYALIDVLADNLAALKSDDVFFGFRPTAAPTV